MQSRGKSVIEKPRTFLGFQMNEHASKESESEREKTVIAPDFFPSRFFWRFSFN